MWQFQIQLVTYHDSEKALDLMLAQIAYPTELGCSRFDFKHFSSANYLRKRTKCKAVLFSVRM